MLRATVRAGPTDDLSHASVPQSRTETRVWMNQRVNGARGTALRNVQAAPPAPTPLVGTYKERRLIRLAGSSLTSTQTGKGPLQAFAQRARPASFKGEARPQRALDGPTWQWPDQLHIASAASRDVRPTEKQEACIGP
jgi:hypothetical protein